MMVEGGGWMRGMVEHCQLPFANHLVIMTVTRKNGGWEGRNKGT